MTNISTNNIEYCERCDQEPILAHHLCSHCLDLENNFALEQNTESQENSELFGYQKGKYVEYSDYGWKIIWCDPDIFEDCEEIGTMGPSTIHPDIQHKLDNYTKHMSDKNMYMFDMYDDDGERYFAGVLYGENVDGDEPLIDYGMPYSGCTEIVLSDESANKQTVIKQIVVS